MISQSPIFFRLVTTVVSEEEQSVRLSIFMVFTGTALHFGGSVKMRPCAEDRHASAASPSFEKPQIPLNRGDSEKGPQRRSGRSGL